MNPTSIITSGERLSFFQLFEEKELNIEIPIIQRDYAQGRSSSEEVREAFLDALFLQLNEGEEPLDLDFVYGTIEDNAKKVFIPLDGQQRLTTLFLLNWYIANNEGQYVEFKRRLYDGKHSRFGYETRTSSREFCDALVCAELNLNRLLIADEHKKNSLSKTLKDNAWYFLSWEYDPTIQSMLTMLDSIHNLFHGTIGFFEKLNNTLNPIITFQFLNLNEFKLTDDLYIKMNARGKALTPFETFKAKFEQLINAEEFPDTVKYVLRFEEGERQVSVQEYFSHKVDADWSNLFWNYKDPKKHVFDDQIMNFIRVFVTNSYASRESNEMQEEHLATLIGKKDPNGKKDIAAPISFSAYKVMGCFNDGNIVEVICMLDKLSNGSDPAKTYLTNDFYYDEKKLFVDVLATNLNYTERIQFYAYCNYLLIHSSYEGFQDWMRVVHNLSENSIYNNIGQYILSVKSVQKLTQYGADILGYLADSGNQIDGFVAQQIEEERLKAVLMLKEGAWRQVILNAEQHGYFKGQISFLLKFAGISQYYSTNKHCNWSSIENDWFLNCFVTYYKKAEAIFDADGLKAFDKYLWQRTLLTKDDYMLSYKTNHSLLVNNHRDISWKRLLRNNDQKTLAIKAVFDDVLFDASNPSDSLDHILSQTNVPEGLWIRHFIETPEIIDYMGSNKFIRYISENEIYLLRKERMNGMHAEYRSYAYYRKNLKGQQFPPFSSCRYRELSGDEEQPSAVVGNWEHGNASYQLDLFYAVDKNKYQLNFSERNGLFENEIILNALRSNGFRQVNTNFESLLEEVEIEGKLLALCNTLISF